MNSPDDHIELIQALMDSLRFERDMRTDAIAHSIKCLRCTCLMLAALLLAENDINKFESLEAIHAQVNDLKLWMEEQLRQEMENKSNPIEGEKTQILH